MISSILSVITYTEESFANITTNQECVNMNTTKNILCDEKFRTQSMNIFSVVDTSTGIFEDPNTKLTVVDLGTFYGIAGNGTIPDTIQVYRDDILWKTTTKETGIAPSTSHSEWQIPQTFFFNELPGRYKLVSITNNTETLVFEFIVKQITNETFLKDQVKNLNYTIVNWDDFGHDFEENGAIFKNNFAGLGVLEVGTNYHIIQKAEFTESSFGDKGTQVNATIGYAIQFGDQMLHPPMQENATNEDHEEFSIKIQKQTKEFSQQSSIGDSYDFVVDVKNPFYIKFPLVIHESGQYTRQFYKTTHIFEGPSSSEMGGITVVDKFSKAIDENAQCKNDNFRSLIKYDYSTVVCVDSETALKLVERKWGI